MEDLNKQFGAGEPKVDTAISDTTAPALREAVEKTLTIKLHYSRRWQAEHWLQQLAKEFTEENEKNFTTSGVIGYPEYGGVWEIIAAINKK